jgi:anti-sigma B factor antagonist
LNLSIKTDIREGVPVVQVDGELDVYTAPRLKEALDSAASGGGRVVLDLSAVHFIDSTALGVLVSAQQRLRADDGELSLVLDDPYLLKIFHITGFDGLFSIYSHLAEAVPPS